jgi:hypothetical protein
MAEMAIKHVQDSTVSTLTTGGTINLSPCGQGYSLEDPTVGLPTVQHAHDVGVKVFVAHKGVPLVRPS